LRLHYGEQARLELVPNAPSGALATIEFPLPKPPA